MEVARTCCFSSSTGRVLLQPLKGKMRIQVPEEEVAQRDSHQVPSACQEPG